MIRPVAWLVALLTAFAAEAAWFPVYEPSFIQIRPGQTVTVSVRGAWLSGVSLHPFPPMTLIADDPTIAAIDGHLPTQAPTPVRITGLRPGVTGARIIEREGPAYLASPIIVVAERELPVAIAIEGVLAPGGSLTLRAISDEAEATFTWYSGRLGSLFNQPIGTGREITFKPPYDGAHEYWVLMTSPRGAGVSGVTIGASAPTVRRRAVRH